MPIPRVVFAATLALLCAHIVSAQQTASPEVTFHTNGRVVLVTDYGTGDFYVGALKGAIAEAAPHALIDDATHEVPAFDIAGGAFILQAVAREWPAGTVFAAIVDPGVGTDRRPIALLTRSGLALVGPDNGLFGRVADELGVAEVREIANAALLRPGALSSTFHGRDVFGPIAGYLARGGDLSAVGPAREDVVHLPRVDAAVEGEEIRGQVLLADHYGNLLTNVPQEMLAEIGVESGAQVSLSAGAQTLVAPLLRTYADVAVGEPVAVINSQGLLEFAVNQGSMAERLGVGSGQAIRVRGALFR